MYKLHGKPLDLKQLKSPVLDGLQEHLTKITSIVDYLAREEEQIEQKSCYVCGATSRHPVTTIHGFDYVECDECTHVYTTQRYSDEAIIRFYASNEYWAKATYANTETSQYRRDNVARPKFDFLCERTGLDQGYWLDIGSGIGDLVSVADENGWKATGLELSQTSVKFAKELFGLELRRETLQDHLNASSDTHGHYDVVSMMGLLEHVVDPLGLLDDVRTVLRDDGYIYVQVPNAGSIASMVQSVFPENVFRHMSPIEHIMLFSETSLNTALKVKGFEPIAYWYHGLDIYELLNNICLANPRAANSKLNDTLLSLFNPLQQVIDDAELSDRILCVAKKV